MNADRLSDIECGWERGTLREPIPYFHPPDTSMHATCRMCFYLRSSFAIASTLDPENHCTSDEPLYHATHADISSHHSSSHWRLRSSAVHGFLSHAQCKHPACVTCSMQPAKFHLCTEHTYSTRRSNNHRSSSNGVPECLESLGSLVIIDLRGNVTAYRDYQHQKRHDCLSTSGRNIVDACLRHQSHVLRAPPERSYPLWDEFSNGQHKVTDDEDCNNISSLTLPNLANEENEKERNEKRTPATQQHTHPTPTRQ
jgi:hypothetical protein